MEERRKLPRTPVPQDLAPLDPETGARLIDLSPEGACLEYAEPVPKGTEVLVRIPSAADPVRIPAVVVWSRLVASLHRPGGGRRDVFHVGVTFTRATAEEDAAIRRALLAIDTARKDTQCQ